MDTREDSLRAMLATRLFFLSGHALCLCQRKTVVSRRKIYLVSQAVVAKLSGSLEVKLSWKGARKREKEGGSCR